MQSMLEDSDVEALYHVGITILGELFKFINYYSNYFLFKNIFYFLLLYKGTAISANELVPTRLVILSDK